MPRDKRRGDIRAFRYVAWVMIAAAVVAATSRATGAAIALAVIGTLLWAPSEWLARRGR